MVIFRCPRQRCHLANRLQIRYGFSHNFRLLLWYTTNLVPHTPVHPFHAPPQLSIKACPNTSLPKTLTSVQLQLNIAELCPAIVTYSPSNHSLQYNNTRLFLFIIFSYPSCLFYNIRHILLVTVLYTVILNVLYNILYTVQ